MPELRAFCIPQGREITLRLDFTMPEYIDPKEFGLPPRTVVEKIATDTLAIVIDRKSRIIMADGRKIVEKARKIRQGRPGVKIILKSSSPVCGKTSNFLSENGIDVFFRFSGLDP